MQYRQVDELLVIGIFAGDRRLGGNRQQLSLTIKSAQHLLGAPAVVNQAFDNLGVSQHPLQLLAHRNSCNPLQVPLIQCACQWLRGRVTENQQVKDDVGV